MSAKHREYGYMTRLTDEQLSERLSKIVRLINDSNDPNFIVDSGDIFLALLEEKSKRHGLSIPWWRQTWISLTSWWPL